MLTILKKIYITHKEIFLYLLFGALSFLLNILLFFFFNDCWKLNEINANTISWIITILFVFFTNRKWVFILEEKNGKPIVIQLVLFFIGRIGTLFLENFLIFIFITKLEYNNLIVKIVTQVIVVVSNFFISKLFVFRKKNI